MKVTLKSKIIGVANLNLHIAYKTQKNFKIFFVKKKKINK